VARSIVKLHPGTRSSRGFGFVTFESENVTNLVLSRAHMIDRKAVEVKRALPKSGVVGGPGLLPTPGGGTAADYYGSGFDGSVGDFGAYPGFEQEYGLGGYDPYSSTAGSGASASDYSGLTDPSPYASQFGGTSYQDYLLSLATQSSGGGGGGGGGGDTWANQYPYSDLSSSMGGKGGTVYGPAENPYGAQFGGGYGGLEAAGYGASKSLKPDKKFNPYKRPM